MLNLNIKVAILVLKNYQDQTLNDIKNFKYRIRVCQQLEKLNNS